jgi:4-hydroxy-tetrahydrodipicolinate reductase
MSGLEIVVTGSGGRMGRAVIALLGERADLRLRAGLDRPSPEALAEALNGAGVVIDFTEPEAAAALAEACAARGGPALVIGTTGLDADQEARIARAAEQVAVVRSGNFSLGVNLLIGLVRQAAAALPARNWDLEIFEAHHRRKTDAPSGTALMLGEAAAAGRGVRLAEAAERGRDGLTGPRREGAIGFSVMRGGGIVGEHSVVLAAEDEILTLSHSARDRSLFARGALEAASWVASRPAGLYGMGDVLGLAQPGR